MIRWKSFMRDAKNLAIVVIGTPGRNARRDEPRAEFGAEPDQG